MGGLAGQESKQCGKHTDVDVRRFREILTPQTLYSASVASVLDLRSVSSCFNAMVKSGKTSSEHSLSGAGGAGICCYKESQNGQILALHTGWSNRIFLRLTSGRGDLTSSVCTSRDDCFYLHPLEQSSASQQRLAQVGRLENAICSSQCRCAGYPKGVLPAQRQPHALRRSTTRGCLLKF